MARVNVYKVFIDTNDDMCDIYKIEAAYPASAIKRVLLSRKYGRSVKMKYFSVSVDLIARNTTLKEYKVKHGDD